MRLHKTYCATISNAQGIQFGSFLGITTEMHDFLTNSREGS